MEFTQTELEYLRLLSESYGNIQEATLCQLLGDLLCDDISHKVDSGIRSNRRK